MYFNLIYKGKFGLKDTEERVYRPSDVYDLCSKEMPDFIEFWNGYTRITYQPQDLSAVENFIDTMILAII
jgi:hypothetical protein